MDIPRALDRVRVAARRPYVPPDHERAGETFSPSPHSDLQASARKPILVFGISWSRPPGAVRRLLAQSGSSDLFSIRFWVKYKKHVQAKIY